ncbi:hypothetical protein [Mucilaginibacter polytrichastri]|uniref:hypothetical protein n=1 Tax=Mucilaginibacter polytrichastri TaxID=1302689 RepID=UPI000B8388DA|nr:hypothetical protein [Mucilaginibacter polytrichastri]
MRIYNKTVSYIGIFLFFSGVYLDYSHNKQIAVPIIPMILGTILMLLAFRKPKDWQEENNDD